MSMTKSDYQLISGVLYWQHKSDWKQICETFANALAKDNPKFKRDEFLKDCGIEGSN